MPFTMKVPIEVRAKVHEIEGGGYWAEVSCFPGCVTQTETLEELKEALVEAVDDWLYGVPVKTEEDARRLAEIQGPDVAMIPGPFPQPILFLPPPGWDEDDD